MQGSAITLAIKSFCSLRMLPGSVTEHMILARTRLSV
jgi:hypothetical protein